MLVDGAEVGTFSASVAWNQTKLDTPIFSLTAGIKTVTIVWPIGAGLELRGIRVNSGAVTSLATRPSNALLVCGDSITQGYGATKATASWPYLLAVAKNRRLINMGYGGRGAVASDGSALAGLSADRVTYMIGYNDFAGQTPLVTFQASVEGWITNARAALPSAKIYVISPIYSTAANTIPLSSYRNAVHAAVLAVGDGNTYFVDGLSIMTNSADRLLDGIHPNDVGAAEISTNLVGVIAS